MVAVKQFHSFHVMSTQSAVHILSGVMVTAPNTKIEKKKISIYVIHVMAYNIFNDISFVPLWHIFIKYSNSFQSSEFLSFTYFIHAMLQYFIEQKVSENIIFT